jgi:hypothetical protein
LRGLRRAMTMQGMATSARIYHLTDPGVRAAWLVKSRLPRRVLQLLRSVGAATSCDELDRLEDLEAIGLLESVSAEWLAELIELAEAAAEPR